MKKVNGVGRKVMVIEGEGAGVYWNVFVFGVSFDEAEEVFKAVCDMTGIGHMFIYGDDELRIGCMVSEDLGAMNEVRGVANWVSENYKYKAKAKLMGFVKEVM